MATYRATIIITLRPTILDVQGKTVEHALVSLGFTTVQHVRIGKHITLELHADNAEKAKQICDAMSRQLLANPVIEDYTVNITEHEK